MKKLQFLLLVVISIFILTSCKSRDSEVIDIEPPLLDCYDVYSIDVGAETPSVTDLCSITDNSDDELDVSFSGHINTDSSGFYYVAITASDQSGNSSSKSITIKVNRAEIAIFSINNYNSYLGMTYEFATNYDNTAYASISFDFDEIIGYEYEFTMWVRVEYTTYNSYYDSYSSGFQIIYIYDWHLAAGLTQSFISINDIVEVNSIEVTYIDGAVYDD